MLNALYKSIPIKLKRGFIFFGKMLAKSVAQSARKIRMSAILCTEHQRWSYLLVNCVLNCLQFERLEMVFARNFLSSCCNFIKVNSKKNDCVARNISCKKHNAEVKIINRFEQYFISKWMEIMCGAKHYVQMDELTLCLIFFLSLCVLHLEHSLFAITKT